MLTRSHQMLSWQKMRGAKQTKWADRSLSHFGTIPFQFDEAYLQVNFIHSIFGYFWQIVLPCTPQLFSRFFTEKMARKTLSPLAELERALTSEEQLKSSPGEYPPTKFNMSTILKGHFIFQPSIFRGYVGFPGQYIWISCENGGCCMIF